MFRPMPWISTRAASTPSTLDPDANPITNRLFMGIAGFQASCQRARRAPSIASGRQSAQGGPAIYRLSEGDRTPARASQVFISWQQPKSPVPFSDRRLSSNDVVMGIDFFAQNAQLLLARRSRCRRRTGQL